MTDSIEQLPLGSDELGELLLAACRDGKAKDVIKILALGANPNFCVTDPKTRRTITPVLAAATYPSTGDGSRKLMNKQSCRMISELLKAGARVGEVAFTYLDVVVACGNIEALDIATEQGIDPIKYGYLCMTSAIRSADTEIIDYLAGKGIPINICDKWGISPFMHICAGTINFRRDENLTSKRKIGWLVQKITLLRDAGLDLNATDSVQATPLIRALAAQNWAVAEALVRVGARTDLKLRNSVGPTHIVAHLGTRDFITFYLNSVNAVEDVKSMKMIKIQPDVKSILATYLKTHSISEQL